MSIRTMPSAPKADDIATVFPKVSNDQLRTRSGVQLSAAACNCEILSFIPTAPLARRMRFRLLGKSALGDRQRGRRISLPRQPPAGLELPAWAMHGDSRLP